MNTSVIRYILGNVLKLEGFLLLLPCIVAGAYQEKNGIYFLIVALISIAIGFIFSARKPKDFTMYLKEGCVATSLSWIILSIFGSLPFYLSGEIPSFTDALFETISGFTTTGASILPEVESLSYCMNFWRCFTHWIGGMGVLVFLLAIIPLSGGSNINLMRAESPGPSVGKLVPKLRHTARLLYIIYFGLTLLEMILLLFGKMSLFDSICTALGTAGTGGFGIKNDSMGSYSVYLQWVVTIFMILFGVNFNAYYLLFFGHIKDAFKVEEVKHYFGIILAAIVVISINIAHMCTNVFDAITKAAFQVGSIITTTGFSTTDFDKWPEFSKGVLVLLMFIGACAGSTGGGIKVSRVVIAVKTIGKELNGYIHPKSVKKISFEHKPVDHDVIRSINVYFMAYIAIFVVSMMFITIENYDFTTSFTAVAATFNNIGPGLSLVGPTHNFGFFNDFSKYILMFDMLAGRLELFPLLILFHPSIWKDLFIQADKRVKGIERRN